MKIRSLFNINITEHKKILKFLKNLKYYNGNILITGGTGFIGKWIIDILININKINKIYITTRNKNKFLNKYPLVRIEKKIHILEVDLIHDKIKINNKLDVIIHLANSTTYKMVNNKKYQMNINIIGSNNIINLANKHKVKKFFFASSGAAYLDKIKGNNFYGIGKLISENLLIANNYLFNKTVIARLYSFYGPLQPISSHYAICNFFKKCIKSQDILIESNGKEIRSYMYIGDLIKIILLLIFNKNKKFIFTDIGSNKKISIYDLSKKIKFISKSKSSIIVKNKKLTKKNDYYPENSLINYNFKEHENFNNALKRTLQYYLNN